MGKSRYVRPDADVVCRAFGYFETCEARGIVEMDPILDELGIERRQLDVSTNRISWDAWAAICNRFTEAVGEEEAESSGYLVTEIEGFAGPLSAATGMFTAPESLYRVALTWLAPFMYRNLEFTYEPLRDGRLEVTARIPDDNRGSRGYMLMFQGALRTIPRLIDLDDALLETLTLDSHLGHWIITPPAERTLWGRVKRVASAVRSSDAVLAELDAQREQLSASWEALARTERSFRNALDQMPAGVGLYRDDEWIYLNPLLAEMIGDEMPTPQELIVGESMSDDMDAVEVEIDTPTGRRTALVATYHGVAFEGSEASMFVAMDVSRRVAAEVTLEKTRDTLKALMETTPDLIMRLDESGMLLDVVPGVDDSSPGWLSDSLGEKLEEVLSDRAAWLDLDEARDAFRRAIRTRRTERLDLCDPGPPRRYIEVRIMPAKSDILVVARDVTTRRTLEERLRQSERMVSLGTLAAGVAHEINNPLAYVIGNLSSVLETHADDLDEDLQKQLADALEGAERVSDIVGRMGSYSRRHPAERIEPVDLREAVLAALEMTSHAVQHTARIRTSFASAPKARGNQRAFEQVITNLVLNAAQAIDSAGGEGTIEIVTGTDDARQPFVHVNDDGPGMSEEVRKRVFDPFYTTKIGSGSGLGLAISQRIVIDHGGAIDIDSVPGEGTTITVTFQSMAEEENVEEVEHAATQPPATKLPDPVSPTGDRRRALVLDDEPRIAQIVKLSLRRQFDVTIANAADEALEVIDRSADDFAVIICDLMMPGIDGPTFYDAMIARHPHLVDRILFITGGAFTEATEAFLAQVENPVLQKPFRVDDIRRAAAGVVDANSGSE